MSWFNVCDGKLNTFVNTHDFYKIYTIVLTWSFDRRSPREYPDFLEPCYRPGLCQLQCSLLQMLGTPPPKTKGLHYIICTYTETGHIDYFTGLFNVNHFND